MSEKKIDIYDLPKEVLINNLRYELFEHSKDPITNSVDLVKCNYCSKYGLVERCADDCPDCEETGYLMDGFEDNIKPY